METCYVCNKDSQEMHTVFIHGIGTARVCGTHFDTNAMIKIEDYKNLGREELCEMYRKRQIRKWN
jgi:hypothetical protein